MVAKSENGKPTKKSGESKRQRFLRLAPPRVTALNARARLVCNLASAGYEYSEVEKQKIVDAGFRVAHSIKSAFEQATAGRERDEFNL